MYYISVQDRIDTDKWCFVAKWHTWDRASCALKEYISTHNVPCRIEWSAHPPAHTKVPSVY